MSRRPRQPRLIRLCPVIRAVGVAAALTITAATASAQVGSTIRVSDRSVVRGDTVQLRDVAQLTGHWAHDLADTVVAGFETGERDLVVTIETIRRLLDEHGANWGKIALTGHTRCRVSRSASPHPPPDTSGSSSLPEPNPTPGLSLSSYPSLRRRVEQLIERSVGVDADQLRIRFRETDRRLLATGDPARERYELEPLASGAGGLGRVPIVIRRYRDDRLVGTDRVTAEVARRYTAVVLTRSVGRGQTVTRSDVELREVYSDNPSSGPVTDLAQAVGLAAKGVLRAGTVLYPHHLRSSLLVRRGGLISVRCFCGGLVIKTVARAAEDGSLNQLIRVRNERSRLVYNVRVTGPQRGVVVDDSLAEPGSASPITSRSGAWVRGGGDR